MESKLSYYWNLEPFSEINEFSINRFYKPVPEDWFIYIADVVSSTRAIEQGRYREVNLVGVSVISAVKNACGKLDIPFVFGGDGASIVLPPEFDEKVQSALLGAQQMAAKEFSFEVRMKRIPVKMVQAGGVRVLIGRHQVSEKLCLAAFSGGGLARAEQLAKSDEQGNFNLRADVSPVFDFEGLECRWNPIPAIRGEFLSVLVQATAREEERAREAYEGVLNELIKVLGPRVKGFSPLSRKNLQISKNPLTSKFEQRIKTTGLSLLEAFKLRLAVLISSLIGFFLIRFSLRAFGTNWGRYFEEVVENSDFFKFDDALRFVVDVDPEQKTKVIDCLERAKRSGAISYGIHSSPHALMTCLVENRQGGHVHFLDGGEGGYTLAAKRLKASKQELVGVLQQSQSSMEN